MRQRLAIARCFLHNPSLLLLTSPSRRSTIAPSRCCQNLLKTALTEGRTIIMSTHQLREALELATDVALINRGKLAFRGPRTWEMLGRSQLVVSSTMERHEVSAPDLAVPPKSALGNSQAKRP